LASFAESEVAEAAFDDAANGFTMPLDGNCAIDKLDRADRAALEMRTRRKAFTSRKRGLSWRSRFIRRPGPHDRRMAGEWAHPG
jgi:hypothetical protein